MVAYVITRYSSDEYGCDPCWDVVQVVLGEDSTEDATSERAQMIASGLEDADVSGARYYVDTPELPVI